MVDISEVTAALAGVIGTVVYPDGEAAASLTTRPVKIYPGWPNEAALNVDLLAGVSHVSVFNQPRMDHDKTTLDDGWLEAPGPSASYHLTVLGNTVTVSGVAPAPHYTHNFALALGGPDPLLYSPPEGRSAAEVAADLRALAVAAGVAATVNGADISIPQPYRISFARVGTIGAAVSEVSRSEKGWQIVVWAPSPEDRATLGKAIKPALDSVPFLSFSGDFSARIKPAGATDSDDPARAGAYRRDLFYTVEVPTTVKVDAPQIVAFQTALATPDGEVIAETLE